MAFLFYLPNLVVVEAFLRARGEALWPTAQWAASVIFVGATAFIILATYEMTVRSWGPAIQASLSM